MAVEVGKDWARERPGNGAVADPPAEVRKDWALADLRCMLCGRVLGRLVGLVQAERATRPPVNLAGRFQLFRPSDPRLPTVRLMGKEQFRCTECGGRALTEDVETFSTFDGMFEDEQPKRRGRPPKRFRPLADVRLASLGLAG